MNIKKKMKTAISSFFNMFGFSIVKNSRLNESHIDVRKEANSYRQMLQYGKPVIVDLPMSKFRWKALAISFDSYHPFVYAVKQACKNDKGINFDVLCDELGKYYELVQPHSMSDCLDIEIEANFPKPQHTSHTRWPWVNKESNCIEFCPVIQGKKMKSLSMSQHGVQHWGPVSHEKMLTEAIKLSQLYNSIQEKGYQRNISKKIDEIVRVYILEKENLEWVAVVFQGQHRVSVASALNIKSIPVRVISIIRRVDVELFPLVVNGTYSKEDALIVFDSFFDKKRPKILNKWLDYVSRKMAISIH